MLRLILCAIAIASNAYAKECFITSENNKLIHVEGDCDKRYPPCSTFKIAIGLMAFDSGILIDETHPKWSELGQWNGIGTIEFTLLEQKEQKENSLIILNFLRN